MPYVVIMTEGITVKGQLLKVGEVLELSEKSAQALVAEDKAVEVTTDGETKALLGDLGTGKANVPGTDENAAAAEIERQKKALADQYNLEAGGTNGKPGLKEAAQAAGVDFPYDVTKGDLIGLIVEQGKAAELVK